MQCYFCYTSRTKNALIISIGPLSSPYKRQSQSEDHDCRTEKDLKESSDITFDFIEEETEVKRGTVPFTSSYSL